jgi:hypothetical protein
VAETTSTTKHTIAVTMQLRSTKSMWSGPAQRIGYPRFLASRLCHAHKSWNFLGTPQKCPNLASQHRRC